MFRLPVSAISAVLVWSACLWSAPSASRTLDGTWCLPQEDLSLTFLGKDSVRVTSSAEDGVNGVGRFEKQDTMFVATISGQDVVIRMGYQYTWRNDSSITARALFITVNGDSAEVPPHPLHMNRCSGPSSKFPPTGKAGAKTAATAKKK